MILIQRYLNKSEELSSGSLLAKGMDVSTRRNKGIIGEKDLIINWGCSEIKCSNDPLIINSPKSVSNSSNKIDSFELFNIECVSTPEYTTSTPPDHWWDNKGKVVCRTVVNSSAGKGIVIASSKDELVEAPLYTRYIKKAKEYRVHILFRELISIQQKKSLTTDNRALRGIVDRDKRIKNVNNGYIFSENLDLSEHEHYAIVEESILAISALGLCFGGVDVLLTKTGEVKVLEVNSACGLSGNTLTKYIVAFNKAFNSRL